MPVYPKHILEQASKPKIITGSYSIKLSDVQQEAMQKIIGRRLDVSPKGQEEQ